MYLEKFIQDNVVAPFVPMVSGQFADKPIRSESSRGLVNSWTSQLAETFDLNFAVNNCYKCDLQ